MKNVRFGFVRLAPAVAALALAGCFDEQPPPECNVTTTTAAYGLSPYYVQLTKVDGTGSCSEHTSMVVGMQRLLVKSEGDSTLPEPGKFKLAIRPSPGVDYVNGYGEEPADYDPSNNCSDEEDCGSCVPEDQADPEDNVCMSVPEDVYRYDPNDPDGEKLTGLGEFPQFPTDGVCRVASFSDVSQDFEEVPLVDGDVIPELALKTNFTDFEVLMTSKAPGTMWRAKLKYEENDCVANYEAFAFWPMVECETQEDCDPEPDEANGRPVGSGINPEFKPVCNVDEGVCVPTATWDDLKK